MDSSFYIGDAAGRAEGWENGRKKDFSCSDRKFAANVGIKFQTAEEFFLDQSPAAFDWGGFDPHSIVDAKEICEGGVESLSSDSQEMVLFVGYPAAGKSTFAKTHLIPKGYIHINRDTLKTQEKCQKVAASALDEGKSVVIDNTNGDPSVRKEYIFLAKDRGVPVRCFWFQTSFELAQHLNYFRERLTDGESHHVPRVGYATFKKYFQEPTLAEGFTQIKKINFVTHFSSEKAKEMFKMWV